MLVLWLDQSTEAYSVLLSADVARRASFPPEEEG